MKNKKDIIIWYRIYLETGGDTDVEMFPLEYRSHKDFQKALDEISESLNFVDRDIVNYDYLTEKEAWAMYHEKDVWEAFDNFFDLSKEYGIPPTVLKSAIDLATIDITEAEDYLQDAFEGEYGTMLDFAYDIVDEELVGEEQYESYFDWEAYGFALVANGVVGFIMMDDWEDRYESETEAQAAYDGITDMRDDKIAEWYIEEFIGDLSDLDNDEKKLYFDYKSFARDLEYEGYEEIDGFIFRPW
jgi:antirestriction protein